MNDLLTELKIEMEASGFKTYNDMFLRQKLKQAIGKVNRARRFTPSENMLYDTKYEDKILELAIIFLAQIGAEGETSHSENGISRSYREEKDVLREIIPLIK